MKNLSIHVLVACDCELTLSSYSNNWQSFRLCDRSSWGLHLSKTGIMNVLGHNPYRPVNDVVGRILLPQFAVLFCMEAVHLGKSSSSNLSSYVNPLDEQQQELGRIDDALKGGIQQIERACKPFIEEDSLDKVELKPDTYLNLTQARSAIEAKGNEVHLKFKNAHNVASLKNSKICNSTTDTQPTDSCVSLMLAQEKLKSLEAYFQKTTTKNVQIFNNFVIVE